MKVIGVIPARLESTRLYRKLLRKLLGKPLIQWTWESAKKARLLDSLIIACDDEKIKETAESFGAIAQLTSVEHASGTDRITEAVADKEARIVVNIQADETFIHPVVIDGLAETMLANRDLVMATVRKKIDDPDEIANPNTVKVVCDKDGYALYFSRFALPYYRQDSSTKVYYKHLGIYAYTKDFLYTFKKLAPSYLEKAEKLEQLRVLEAGYRIKVIDTSFETCGIDTEEDFLNAEKMLREKGYKG